MINDLTGTPLTVGRIEFGESRPFLNVARCGRCGRRVEPSQHGEWCDVCTATTNPIDEIRKLMNKMEHEPDGVLCLRADGEQFVEEYGGELIPCRVLPDGTVVAGGE